VEAVITGDLPSPRSYLSQDPTLVHHQSTRPHHATLLHYIAANGIEDERQITPPNAVEVARLLLEAGAKPDAPCDAYNPKWATTLDLLVSSVHPYNAGVQSALAEILLDFGATVTAFTTTAPRSTPRCPFTIRMPPRHWPAAARGWTPS